MSSSRNEELTRFSEPIPPSSELRSWQLQAMLKNKGIKIAQQLYLYRGAGLHVILCCTSGTVLRGSGCMWRVAQTSAGSLLLIALLVAILGGCSKESIQRAVFKPAADDAGADVTRRVGKIV